MARVLLVVAGVLEVAWAIGLKYARGFERPLVLAATLAAMAASMLLLSLAMRSLPVGTAYAVWVGIGAAGTVVLGILLFDETATPLRLASLTLVVAWIAGLKLSAG